MEFFTTDLNGLTLVNPDETARRSVLESIVDDPEADYPEVYLTLQNGPVIGYRTGGILFWEEDGEVIRTISGVDVVSALEAWNWLIAEDFSSLESLPWESLDD